MGMFGGGSDAKKDCILNIYDRNPNLSVVAIAAECDASESYVQQVIRDNRSGPVDDMIF